MNLYKSITFLLFSASIVVGCYDPIRLDMPGPYDTEEKENVSYPFPFDSLREKGTYLIKNGEADYSKISLLGFTDFAVKESENSWENGVDIHGRKFVGSRQHFTHAAMSDADHFGQDRYSYQYQQMVSRLFLETGSEKQWYLYAKMSLRSLSYDTRAALSFEGKNKWQDRTVTVFDWQSGGRPVFAFFRKGGLIAPLDGKYYQAFLHAQPDETFDYELICVNNFVYCRINGTVIWSETLNAEKHAFPFIISPWKNSVKMYDLYVEGDYNSNRVVASQFEAGYKTIQSPSVINEKENVLLFAEGRKHNVVQTSSMESVRSNATDIVLKKSTDGGESWSDLEVLVGGDETVNMRPTVVRDQKGAIHLIYTVDETGDQRGDYKIYRRTSTNNGQDWSSAVEIPCALDGYILSTEQGAGVCTEDGTLIVPMQCTQGSRATVATLFSSDDGENWTLGNTIEGMRFNSMKLLATGNVVTAYLSHASTGSSYLKATSRDGGATWTSPELMTVKTGTRGHQLTGTFVQLEDGRVVVLGADNYVRANNFAGGIVGSDVAVDLKQRKSLYLYKAPEFAKGLTFSISNEQQDEWSALAPLQEFTTFDEHEFLVGEMDAVNLGNGKVLLISEGGALVPHEGLIAITKQL